jgi:hypothetical protein
LFNERSPSGAFLKPASSAVTVYMPGTIGFGRQGHAGGNVTGVYLGARNIGPAGIRDTPDNGTLCSVAYKSKDLQTAPYDDR